FPWAVVFGHTNALANEPATSVRSELAQTELLGRSTELTEAQQVAAHQLGWIAFGDIVVFFGLLLVGFAYLWKRGDLNWVRSLAPESPAVAEAEIPRGEAGVLVGAGHE